jgi:hypothetical protein
MDAIQLKESPGRYCPSRHRMPLITCHGSRIRRMTRRETSARPHVEEAHGAQIDPPRRAGGEDGEGVHRLAPHAPRARERGARGGVQPLEYLRVKEVGEGLAPRPYTYPRPLLSSTLNLCRTISWSNQIPHLYFSQLMATRTWRWTSRYEGARCAMAAARGRRMENRFQP